MTLLNNFTNTITSEIGSKILLLLNEGYNVNKIIQKLNLPETSVRRWLKTNNIKVNIHINPIERMKNIIFDMSTTKSVPQIAKEFNCSASSIRRLLARYDVKPILKKDFNKSKNNKSMIIEMLNNGYSTSDIIRQTGCYYRSIIRTAKQEGLSLNKRLYACESNINKIINYINEGMTQAQIASVLNLKSNTLSNFLKRHNLTNLVNTSIVSKDEEELAQLIQNKWNIDIIRNYRLKNKQQIDIYIPSLKIGIEYNGIYWHSENSPSPRNRSYHYNKMKQAKMEDIRLITIFEDEWILNKDCIIIYLHDLIRHSKIQKIYARNTLIKEVDYFITNDFLDQYHIQGSNVYSKISIGLYDHNVLIGIITGSHHHRNIKNILVLSRLCFKSGYTIVGGASKLFSKLKKWAKDNNYSKIISWSDNRWSEGRVYEKMGFTLEAELPPDYSYIKKINQYFIRKSKQSLKKTKEERLTGKTEYQLRSEQGYSRIWDCGKKRWILNLD
jgi:transposase